MWISELYCNKILYIFRSTSNIRYFKYQWLFQQRRPLSLDSVWAHKHTEGLFCCQQLIFQLSEEESRKRRSLEEEQREGHSPVLHLQGQKSSYTLVQSFLSWCCTTSVHSGALTRVCLCVGLWCRCQVFIIRLSAGQHEELCDFDYQGSAVELHHDGGEPRLTASFSTVSGWRQKMLL